MNVGQRPRELRDLGARSMRSKVRLPSVCMDMCVLDMFVRGD